MRTPADSPEAPHRGITMHRIAFGGGIPGLVFTVGSMAIFLIALPQLWFFLGLAVALGCAVAAVLSFAHRHAKTESTFLPPLTSKR